MFKVLGSGFGVWNLADQRLLCETVGGGGGYGVQVWDQQGIFSSVQGFRFRFWSFGM